MMLLITFYVLAVLDAYTTKEALRTNPNAREANPVIRWLMEKLGDNGWVGAKMVATLVAGILLYPYPWVLAVVSSIYLLIFLNNLRFIK